MILQDNIQYKTAFILFGGIGGETNGLMKSQIEYGGSVYRFKVLGSVDYDPVACHNHDIICGEKTSICMDLFTREQYIAWHGEDPPPEWKEMTPWDMWVAMGKQVPFFLFTSPPCKGLSGLLPEKSAKTDKYQALNQLTVRGIWLVLEACRLYGDGLLPAIIQLENVPRIRTRGKVLLQQIERMLKKHRYAVNMRVNHNLGKIGGLGAYRVRFLIMSRQEDQVANFIFYPEEKPLRSIGDVIGELPMPGDIEAGGPLHRLPNLQWKTWVRLGLIPAGGDWRDLQDVPYEQYRIIHEPRVGAFAVENWGKPSRTVTGTTGPGRSNGVAAVSDPRVGFKDSTHGTIYRVCRDDQPGPTVTGAHRPNNGALAVADPRVKTNLMPDSYGVQDWDSTGKTVRGASRIMNSPTSISDPRLSDLKNRYPDKYRVQDMDNPAATITGVSDVQAGAPLVADHRLKCSPRAGSYGVQDWNEPGKTVTGAGDIHSGTAALADPRIPLDTDRGAWILIAEDGTWHRPLTTYELAMLQSFPRFLPDGRPFQLEGCSDAKAREYIGNAVPCDAAKAMGNVILLAAAQAEAGETFTMSWDPIWVAPVKQEEDRAIIH
ncbi:site-specific DNA-cytosine methylase [Fontibacillus solani]|uniref:Site-specific DNA-cytosine methylase n=1 Tax=Fontibacillus solani TaxID=1572857 RepID=A0A7W3SUS3_9BACL|nr:DNA cytosine methyltransferase [Fontibacillus solani]MBA9086530.1 site-specific DNA-cytosine methylase [Fontibacillus solani]